VNSGLEKALNCELTNCALPVLIQNQQTQVMRHVCIADSGEENPLILTRSGIDTYHSQHHLLGVDWHCIVRGDSCCRAFQIGCWIAKCKRITRLRRNSYPTGLFHDRGEVRFS